MSAEFDPRVQIFVAEESKERLVKRLSGFFWGRIEDDCLKTRGFFVEIRAGEDRARKRDRQDDFLFWPLLVELEAADGVSLDHHVAVTGRLLERFWEAGLSAVATCGFEYLLPWNGGTQSPEMPPPWVVHAKPPLRMRWAWFDDLDFLDEFTAESEGEPFTGYSVDHDPPLGFDVVTVLNGTKRGAEYIVDERSGVLREFGAYLYGNICFGGSYQWDSEGNLRSETNFRLPGTSGSKRQWDADGRLVSEEPDPSPHVWNGAHVAVFGDQSPSETPGFGLTSRRIGWDEAEQRFVDGDLPYWGFLATAEDGGRTRVCLVLDGREEGPVWESESSGKLVLQGMLHHAYGQVGPWHEWDETGRLLSETIYDALGNRIIDRRLDEAGNIAHEERYEPTRLWRDRDTGEERPAPWLWF